MSAPSGSLAEAIRSSRCEIREIREIRGLFEEQKHDCVCCCPAFRRVQHDVQTGEDLTGKRMISFSVCRMPGSKGDLCKAICFGGIWSPSYRPTRFEVQPQNLLTLFVPDGKSPASWSGSESPSEHFIPTCSRYLDGKSVAHRWL